jgi:hypothetical protein
MRKWSMINKRTQMTKLQKIVVKVTYSKTVWNGATCLLQKSLSDLVFF